MRNGVYTRGETQTVGAYIFDTLSFAERWQITGGFRLDAFDTQTDGAALSTLVTYPTLPVGTLVPTSLEADDTLFSYKIGVLYKPVPNGSIYLSTATSQQPPGGANFTLSSATQQCEPFRPRAHRRLEPRAGSEMGVPGRRAGRDRRTLRQLEQERTHPRCDQSGHLRAGGRARGQGCRARHRGQTHRQLGLLGRHRQDGYRDRPGQLHADRLADQLVAGAHLLELDHVHDAHSAFRLVVARATSTPLRGRSTRLRFPPRPAFPTRPSTG